MNDKEKVTMMTETLRHLMRTSKNGRAKVAIRKTLSAVEAPEAKAVKKPAKAPEPCEDCGLD